ncbi:polysaccharide biosynthesis protein [Onishia taeanensis]
MYNFINHLFRLPRIYKRVIQVTADTALLAISFLSAMSVKFDHWDAIFDREAWLAFAITLPVSIYIFVRMGFYRAIIRYMNQRAISMIFMGILATTMTFLAFGLALKTPSPTSVSIVFFLFSMMSIGGIRFLLRSSYVKPEISNRSRVVIYGAGDAGSHLFHSLKSSHEYVPVAFADDWRGMYGNYVEGLEVHSPAQLPQLINDYGIEKILLAIPSATRARRRKILNALEPLMIPVQTVPGTADIVAGRAKINDIRNVTVEDLLGRDPVPPQPTLMQANIMGKVVMVTGAGGSIGSELSRQILLQRPRQLLLLDVCEYALYQVEQQIQTLCESHQLDVSIKPLLASIQHRPRLTLLMRSFGVQTLYHAAAYKHVPMVEHNMIEGIRNNVLGTLKTAQAAIECGVETFVLVSTDKAVRPTNVMGTTKRLAEIICQALASEQAKTRFCMVRFGNVLGSSGSVVPLFRRQIRDGGPITVTHPEITRYFMTIPEAAQLVIQAGAMGSGGDVFVLDMGEPIRIAELAKQMVRLSGLELITEDNPDGDIAIQYSGLRPGEKLYEELLVGTDTTPTAHPRIMTARETFWEWSRLEAYLARLQDAVARDQHELIRSLLLEAPTAYHPHHPISDLLWVQNCSEKKVPLPTEAAFVEFETQQKNQEGANSSQREMPAQLKVSVAALLKGNHF